MSSTVEERPISARVPERPCLKRRQIREIEPRQLAVRFIAGALTSIAAGAVTLAFGSRVGGILLAFPAILAASLTLIEHEEDSAEAREDARGAVIGAIALGTFAAVAALTLGSLSAAIALAVATAAWVVVAVGGYFVAWFR